MTTNHKDTILFFEDKITTNRENTGFMTSLTFRKSLDTYAYNM